MQVKKFLTLRQTIITIIITLLLLICGTSILLLPVLETGYSREQITLDTPRHFSDLNYTLDNNSVSFPEGGYLVPILHKNKPMAIAIYGYGSVIRSDKNYDTKECLIILTEGMYYELMNQLYLQTSDETVFIDRTNDALTKMYNYMPFIVTPTGKKFFSFPNDFRAIMLLDSNASIKGLIKDSNHHAMKSIRFGLIAFSYILIFLAILGIIILLTNRRQVKIEKESFYIFKPSPDDFRFHMIFIILIWIGLACTITNNSVKAIFLIGSLCYSIYYLVVKKEIYAGYLRIRYDKFLKAIPLSFLCGLMLFVLSTTSIPISYNSFSTWLNSTTIYNWVLVVWICFFGFSYLLYELERHFSLNKSIIILLIVSNITMFTVLLLSGVTLAFSILNALLFTSIYFIIAATLVLRTDSVFSAAMALVFALVLTAVFL